MTARVMSARFASQCGACGSRIAAGASIRYLKGYAANHDACGDPSTPTATRSRGRGGRSTFGAPYRGAGRTWSTTDDDGRVHVFSGRCEDAPCCGCCS